MIAKFLAQFLEAFFSKLTDAIGRHLSFFWQRKKKKAELEQIRQDALNAKTIKDQKEITKRLADRL